MTKPRLRSLTYALRFTVYVMVDLTVFPETTASTAKLCLPGVVAMALPEATVPLQAGTGTLTAKSDLVAVIEEGGRYGSGGQRRRLADP